VDDWDWIKCKYGLYRNDTGFVCGQSVSEVIAAFVPRIPTKSSRDTGSAKRKRVTRPEPRRWSAQQIEAIWGRSQVRRTSDEGYEFRHETYKSGLILKHIPFAKIARAETPSNIGPFVLSTHVYNLPTFGPVIRHFAQDSIKVGQRVRVVSGDLRGLKGHPVDIEDGVAAVEQQSGGDTPPLLIPIRSLSLAYEPGDHVKHRWTDSSGMVVSVDEARETLSFVEKDSHEEVCSRCINATHNNILSVHRSH
jgi:hypothetical protein